MPCFQIRMKSQSARRERHSIDFNCWYCCDHDYAKRSERLLPQLHEIVRSMCQNFGPSESCVSSVRSDPMDWEGIVLVKLLFYKFHLSVGFSTVYLKLNDSSRYVTLVVYNLYWITTEHVTHSYSALSLPPYFGKYRFSHLLAESGCTRYSLSKLIRGFPFFSIKIYCPVLISLPSVKFRNFF